MATLNSRPCIESILLGGGSSGVAEVNGESISPLEVEQAVNTQKRQLIAMMGDSIDPSLLDDQRLQAQALDNIISRRLLMQSATDMDLAVSDRQLGAVIGGMEQFQMDGKFSADLYKSLLSGAGFTPDSFKRGLRQDMVLTQLRAGLAGSEFVTPAELQLSARIDAEQRDVRYLAIPVTEFKEGVDVTDAQIKDYYDRNQADFRTRESVELDYIVLGLDNFREPVDEKTVQETYELQKDSYGYSTENRVSHILFERGDDESEQALQSRVSKAQTELAEGKSFAAVAGEMSDDVGSAGNGGDLGFSAGDAFPEEMEKAIATMDLNTISKPIETDAGVHLLMVTERREGSAPTLEELRPELEQQIQDAEARRELISVVEDLKDRVFNAENLDGPARDLDLEVVRSEAVTRSQETGLFANPTLLAAAFSEDVLEAGHNSEVIDTGGDNFVVLRVRKHNPPAVLPLEQVREQIIAAMTDEAARDAVTAKAEQIVAQLRAGESLEAIAKQADYKWQVELGADRRNTMLPPAVLQRAFELPVIEQGQTLVDYVLDAEGDAVVLQLLRVNQGDVDSLPKPQQLALRQQMMAEYGSLVQSQYQQGLRADADISVLQ